MLSREAHVGQHVGLGLIHQGGKLADPRPGLIGDLAPLLACGLGIVLGKGSADPRGDDAALCLAGIGHGVAHEVDAARLPGRHPAPW